jgi:hypothetical protein
LTTLAFGGIMTQSSIQSPVTIQELLISRLAQTDALAKLLIEKGLITQEEFMQKISEERATYQKLLNQTPQ